METKVREKDMVSAQETSPRRPVMIDLFAGCGGLSLGLHAAQWVTLLAIEKDPMAFETYRRNLVDPGAPYGGSSQWPSWMPMQAHDIDAVMRDEDLVRHLEGLRGEVDLVAGGPPCQGFSVGGARNGRDQRNHLVHRLLDIVDLTRPRLVLVENVEGITRPFLSRPNGNKSSVADEVVLALEQLGYAARHFVVDSSRFGVPQIRRRVLILAVSEDACGTGRTKLAQFPVVLEESRVAMLEGFELPIDRPVSAGEAIADLAGERRVTCPDSPKFEAGTYREVVSQFGWLMRRGLPDSQIPNSHRFTKHGPAVERLYKDAHATQPPGRLTKAFLLSQGTKKDKKVLLDPNCPSSTITTHPDEFIHFAEPRNITVREMARLQSFPDDFDFHGRYTINGPRRRFDVARCSQVGNAVPPLLAQAVGAALATLLARPAVESVMCEDTEVVSLPHKVSLAGVL